MDVSDLESGLIAGRGLMKGGISKPKLVPLENHPELRRQFPLTQSAVTQTVARRWLELGREYLIWFASNNADLPDLALGLTVESEAGRRLYGSLRAEWDRCPLSGSRGAGPRIRGRGPDSSLSVRLPNHQGMTKGGHCRATATTKGLGSMWVRRLALAGLLCGPGASGADPLTVAGPDVWVFGGGDRTIPVQFSNATNNAAEATLSHRLFQVSSGSAAPVSPAIPWKSLTIGPGQTVTDSVRVSLEPVRGPTAYHLVWASGGQRIGSTRLWVYPDTILRPLNDLAGGGPVGLVDPDGLLTNALAQVRIETLPEAEAIEAFAGTIILVAPMSPTNRVPGLTSALKGRAGRGAGVVWLISPIAKPGVPPTPSVWLRDRGTGRVVLADPSLLADLGRSPAAQLRLVALAELAVGRTKPSWPADAGSELFSDLQ